jgi:hypothetical protein
MTGDGRSDAMQPRAHAVVLAMVAGGLLTGRVLADCYHRVRLMRVIAMFDPPAWLMYAAILLHVAPANPRRRNESRSADGMVTVVRL